MSFDGARGIVTSSVRTLTGLKPMSIRSQIQKASSDQSRTDQQHDRQTHLRDNKGATQAVRARDSRSTSIQDFGQAPP